MLFQSDGMARPSDALVQAYAEICVIVENLRRSRESLRHVASERLRHTSEKLREVTSVTEMAAIDILDRLDRAQSLVDRLDTLDTSGDAASAETRVQLRDELFMAQGGLQFQDITSQQLAHATHMIEQLEARLASLAELLDPRALVEPRGEGAAEDPQGARRLAFAPNATMSEPEVRQALADRIFESPAA